MKIYKEWYTDGVNENYPISPSTSKILPLSWSWTSTFKRTPPPPPPPHPPPHPFLSRNDNQSIKENIIQGWLLYVIRPFLQVCFGFQYQLINLVWLSFGLFSFSWSLISAFSWLYTLVCAVVQKYHKIYNFSYFCYSFCN